MRLHILFLAFQGAVKRILADIAELQVLFVVVFVLLLLSVDNETILRALALHTDGQPTDPAMPLCDVAKTGHCFN